MWAAVLVKSFTIEAAETAAALSGSLCMKWIEPHPATGVLFRRALEWIHCRLRPWLLPTTRCMRRRRRPTINTQGTITVYCVQGTQFATEPLWIVTIMIGGREKYHSRNADKLCKRWSKAEFFPECKQIQQTNGFVVLSNKRQQNNKRFQGTCDTRVAWQVELDMWLGGWVLLFIDRICLFTRHVWPFKFKLYFVSGFKF